MAFVPVPNIVEVFCEHTYAGAPGKGWVLHYDAVNTPWTLEMMDDLAGAIITWWNTYIKPTVNSQVVFERIRMRELSSVNSLVFDTSTGLPLVGTRAGTPTQSQVVLSVKKGTGIAGKSFRGRVYHFGFNTGDLSTANTVSTAYSSLVETAWQEALLHIGTLDQYGLVVVSRETGGQPRVTGVATAVTQMSLVDRRVDTNRLKLPKGGA